MRKSGNIVRYSSKEVARLVLETRKPGMSIAQLCWKYDLRPNIVELWINEHSGCSTQMLMQKAGMWDPY